MLAMKLFGLPLFLSAAAEPSRFGLLKVDPGLIIWTALTFIALVLLLRKTAWGPIIDGLERREENIRKSLDEAESARAEAVKLIEEQKAVLDEARREVQEIIEQGRHQAGAMRDEIVAKAQTEAAKAMENARQQMQVEVKQAREQLRGEVVELSVEVAGKLLERSLNDEDHQRLAGKFIEEVKRH